MARTLERSIAAEIQRGVRHDEAMKMINALYGKEAAVRANASGHLEDAACAGC